YVAPAPIEDRLVMHDSVEACVVTGANLGQPLGIVMLAPDAVERCTDAAARAELESSLAQHLKAVNAPLDPHERLQGVVVVTTAWTVDNDVITPTFKVKRNRIEDLYATHYARWEASGKPVIWQSAA
ncbi:MAG: AMP-binding acetyl-CoA synthetase, partial [Burkholderiaceae bacterium]|nr:AMP-binding acetyl-CoA synthetase [Burkholderiaceae bacterium]